MEISISITGCAMVPFPMAFNRLLYCAAVCGTQNRYVCKIPRGEGRYRNASVLIRRSFIKSVCVDAKKSDGKAKKKGSFAVARAREARPRRISLKLHGRYQVVAGSAGKRASPGYLTSGEERLCIPNTLISPRNIFADKLANKTSRAGTENLFRPRTFFIPSFFV